VLVDNILVRGASQGVDTRSLLASEPIPVYKVGSSRETSLPKSKPVHAHRILRSFQESGSPVLRRFEIRTGQDMSDAIRPIRLRFADDVALHRLYVL
jgi:hypothetical protein